MSAGRKLQAEIDKTLKKIDEGIEQYESKWDDFEEADGPLKEKLEGELKRELKRLQKLREMVKTWASSGETKKKDALLTARRRIEEKMEAFKDYERDAKTKAYSKEGLIRAANRELSPEEKALEDALTWIRKTVATLSDQIDELEADAEEEAGKRRTDEDMVEFLETTISNHRFHVEKLETMARLLDNDALGPEAVESVKDDIEYYVECCREPDFYADLEVYDRFDLDERTAGTLATVGLVTAAVAAEAAGLDKEEETQDSGAAASGGGSSSSGSEEKKKKEATTTTSAPTSTNTATTSSADKTSKKSTTTTTTTTTTATAPKPAPKPAPNAYAQGASIASVLRASTAPQPPQRDPVATVSETREHSAIAATVVSTTAPTTSAIPATTTSTSSTTTAPPPSTSTPADEASKALSAARNAAKALSQLQSQVPEGDEDGIVEDMLLPSPKAIDPTIVPRICNQLQGSLAFLPEGRDYPETDPYIPRFPAPTHPAFPTEPLRALVTPEAFAKFDADTLFFAFYYQQNLRQQYLAAKELRKQSWRYHTRYSTWFMRHEEPVEKTTEFERGTYVYFDYETGWCPRIKRDFQFRYQFLENELK